MIAGINTDHTHPELTKIEDLESRISVLELSQEVTENRFLSIENTITILQSEHDTYNTFQVQIDAIQVLVDSIILEIDVIKNPVDGGEDDSRFPPGLRIVYFTAPGLESVEKTDRMAKSLKDGHGYPITIVTLTPEIDKANDVPMLIIYPEERIVRGTSNCITYFSSLTF